MKFFGHILFFISIIILSNCTVRHGIANFHTESTSLIKPTYRDTAVTKSYVSGNVNYTSPQIFPPPSEYNHIFSGAVQYHKVRTKEHSCVAIGGFLHGGNYSARPLDMVAGGNKSFFGGGITAEASANGSGKKMDWRILGIKLTMLGEFGDYTRFRSEIEDVTSKNLNPNDIGTNVSLFSEVIYKHDDYDLGYSFLFGLGNQIITHGQSLFLTRGRNSYFINLSSSIQGVYLGGGMSFRLDSP